MGPRGKSGNKENKGPATPAHPAEGSGVAVAHRPPHDQDLPAVPVVSPMPDYTSFDPPDIAPVQVTWMDPANLDARKPLLIDFDLIDPAKVYRSPPHERIRALKQGVPAKHIDSLSSRMKITKESLIDTLRLSRATVNRKARSEDVLSQDESERVLGMESLIGQVQSMVQESSGSDGFEAAAWVSCWMYHPLPALNGNMPASFMDSIEGQKMVSNLLAMAQSGAYA